MKITGKEEVFYQRCLLELGHSSPDNSDDAGKLVARHARVVGAALLLFILNLKVPSKILWTEQNAWLRAYSAQAVTLLLE